jgi:hypothetical protein
MPGNLSGVVVILSAVSFARRQKASRRLRAAGARGAGLDEIEQADLGAYALALIAFIVMAVFSAWARRPIEALGLTFQTGTVLLASPELLRPIGRLGYMQRPLPSIRHRRRRMALSGLSLVVIATGGLVARHLLGGGGTGENLPWAVTFVAALLGYLAAAGMFAMWEIEGLLEGAADRQFRSALGHLDARRTREVRWAIAGAMFGFGTLLLYVGAYG